ncbi:MAG: ceramidase domain-containing protein [Verrucomicrobia bacterium]|nr:ceramidase domain-containing protein [Verrucomicrobiota bacterium]
MTIANRKGFIIAFTVLSVVAAMLLPAMPQPAAYHDFADQRAMFGVANFLDVASNVGFVLAALAGLVVALHPRTRFERRSERWPYVVFFLGMLLTGLGSGYYHLAPDNERLFWDRLPMTIAFMALIAAQVGDRISVRMGLVLLPPLLLVGAASVIYWRMTERAGAGNVMPYGVLQGYSVVIVLLLATLPSRYTRGHDIYWVFAAYVVAKLLETFDREFLALGHLVSGHTLKHLAAAVAGIVVCRMLMLRTLHEPAVQPDEAPGMIMMRETISGSAAAARSTHREPG